MYKNNSTQRMIIAVSVRNGIAVLTLVLLMMFAGAFFAAVTPLVLGTSVENLFVSTSSVRLSFSGLRLLLAIGVALLFVQFANMILQKTFEKSFMNFWIEKLCRKICSIEMRAIESYEAGYLNKRIVDEMRPIPELFSTGLPGLLESSIVMLFSLVMLIVLLPKVTLVLVTAAIVFVPIGLCISKKAQQLLKAVVEQWSRFEGFTTEFLMLQTLLRSFSAEERVCDIIGDRISRVTTSSLKNSLWVALMFTLLLLILVGGMVLFLVHAERSPSIASAKPSVLVSFLAFLWLFTGRLSAVVGAFSKIQNSLACLERMTELLGMPERPECNVSLSGDRIQHLSITDLTAEINKEVVFSGVSFSAKKGEVIAIHGRSGCGKTTLLKTIFGLYPRAAGIITVNGIPVDGLKNIGEHVLLLPQDVAFLSGPLKWNMELLTGRKLDNQELYDVLITLRMGGRFDSNSLQTTLISESGGNLSGGEKRRLAFGAVLLRKPELVLLDEPTSQLDSETQEVVISIVKELANSGTIVIIVSHDSTMDSIASSIVVIKHREEIDADCLSV